jgi:hypothetical protein
MQLKRLSEKPVQRLETVHEGAIASLSLRADPYVVYLINKCNWVAMAIIDERGGVTPLNPPIGRTCALGDCKACSDNQQFVPLLTTSCDSAAFKIALRVHHPKGVTGDTTSAQINPDCKYVGEVVCLDIPDPH